MYSTSTKPAYNANNRLHITIASTYRYANMPINNIFILYDALKARVSLSHFGRHDLAYF